MLAKDQCFQAAGKSLGVAMLRLLQQSPSEIARAAHKPHGPSIEELEARAAAFHQKYAPLMELA